jgi:hypothetical protein
MLSQTHWSDHQSCSHFIEVGNKDSAIRVRSDYFRLPVSAKDWAIHAQTQFGPHPDLVMLYEYLKESGRVIHLTDNIAMQTIRYLKETN